MATGGARERRRPSGDTNDDFRHTCGLCMEPYKGRQPKLLPCFHTFCLPCLTALAESAAVQTRSKAATGEGGGEKEPVQIVQGESEKTTEGSCGQEKSVEQGQCGVESVPGDGVCTQPVVFLCPTCRRPVTLPEGGVTQLQGNFYLDRDEADETYCAVSCDLCEEDRKQDATYACQECQMNICRSCRRYHDKFPGARAHHVTPVGQGDLRMTPQPLEKKLCQSHPDQSLCFFCQKCDVTICLHCKLTSHEGHVTVDIAVASVQAKPEVDVLKVKLNEQIRVLGSLLERLDNEERQLARKKQDVTREVNTRYDEAVTRLTQAHGDVIYALTTKEQTALRDLQTERTSARVAMETLQAAQSRASRAVHGGPDVVHVKTELQAVLLDDVTIRQHGERADREGEATGFFGKCVEGLLRDYIGHVTKEQTQHDATVMSVSEIMAQMAHLKTTIADLKAELVKTASETTSAAKENVDLGAKIAVITAELTKSVDGAVSFNTRVDSLETTVGSLARQLPSSSGQAVYFHVGLTRPKWVNSQKTLVFEKVMSNAGNAYDSKIGFFTAPVTGMYFFITTVLSREEEKNVVAYIVDDNQDYACARGSSQSVGSCHAVIKLDAGVKVRVTAGPSGPYSFCRQETSFSGFLVAQ